MLYTYDNLPLKKLVLIISLFLYTGCAASIKHKNIREEEPYTFQSGIEGRVIKEEKFNYLPGARVYAYSDVDFESSKYFVSEPADNEGKYRLLLPEGQYYIVAKKSHKGETKEGKLKIDDYYCYYGGNPITVQKGDLTFIGLNCTKKRKYTTYQNSKEKNKCGVTGNITYKEQPLEGAFALVFENTEKNFRGSFYAVSEPTGTDGSFKIDLPPGKYYISVKKMMELKKPYIHPFGKGKIIERISLTAGPMKQGDYHFYYDENPIEVKADCYTEIDLPCSVKISEDERNYYNLSVGKMRIEGQIVDQNNNPVENAHAFATTQRLLEDMPNYISNTTKKDGKFVINISKPGWYYIGGRNYLGRPMKKGDLFGYYNQVGNNIIKVSEDTIITDITIKIALIE